MDGIEYYTKGEVAKAFGDFKPIMYREESALSNLTCMNFYRNLVSKRMTGVRWIRKGTFMMFTCKKGDISDWNFYNAQSRGIETLIMTIKVLLWTCALLEGASISDLLIN